VGSIEKDIGIPQTIGFLINLDKVKDETIFNTLTDLLIVKYLTRFISIQSIIYFSKIENTIKFGQKWCQSIRFWGPKNRKESQDFSKRDLECWFPISNKAFF